MSRPLGRFVNLIISIGRRFTLSVRQALGVILVIGVILGLVVSPARELFGSVAALLYLSVSVALGFCGEAIEGRAFWRGSAVFCLVYSAAVLLNAFREDDPEEADRLPDLVMLVSEATDALYDWRYTTRWNDDAPQDLRPADTFESDSTNTAPSSDTDPLAKTGLEDWTSRMFPGVVFEPFPAGARLYHGGQSLIAVDSIHRTVHCCCMIVFGVFGGYVTEFWSRGRNRKREPQIDPNCKETGTATNPPSE